MDKLSGGFLRLLLLLPLQGAWGAISANESDEEKASLTVCLAQGWGKGSIWARGEASLCKNCQQSQVPPCFWTDRQKIPTQAAQSQKIHPLDCPKPKKIHLNCSKPKKSPPELLKAKKSPPGLSKAKSGSQPFVLCISGNSAAKVQSQQCNRHYSFAFFALKRHFLHAPGAPARD